MSGQTGSDILTSASEYTKRGWVVHPLSRPDDQEHPDSAGKRPLLSGWQKLTATPDNINEYLKKGYNIGLVCGQASGVTLIDLDHELFMPELLNGFELDTLMSSRTKGRGHIYLGYVEDLKAQKHPDLGIEILNDGSNAVLPPSIHKSGAVYKWSNPSAGIIKMPAKLKSNLEKLFEHEKKLKTLIKKCRPCFKQYWADEKKITRGANTRLFLGAFCSELFNKGADIELIKMFAKLIYKNEYDEEKTIEEYEGWTHQGFKPWTCDKLQEHCLDFLNCNNCNQKNTREDNRNKLITITKKILSETRFLTIAETDEMYHYNGGIYQPLGEVLIRKRVQELDEKTTTYQTNEIINTIKRKTYTPISELNANPDYIAFQNGVFNLKTMELIPHSPNLLLTVKLPINYNPNTKCHGIDKFFTDILKPDDIPTIYEFFGYCLIRDYHIQKCFMLLGGGGNGKSTLLKLLKAFLGNGAVSSIALQEMEFNHFAVANLFGKLANIYADLSHDALTSTGKIKMLTGGDSITAERKFGGFFTFVNYAKLIFSTNRIPFTFDESDAFFRRWVIINFPNVFEGESEDKNLLQKLTTEEELSGLLNKAILGLQRLLKTGTFSNQKSTSEIREHYVRMSDSVQAFVWDCIENSAEKGIEKQTLYWVYREYCKHKNIPTQSEKTFFKRLCNLVRVEDYRPNKQGYRFRAYVGIFFTKYIENLPVHLVQEVHDSLYLCKRMNTLKKNEEK